MSGKLALDGNPSAQFAVFDDWKGGLSMLPGYKDWFGCQWHISVRKLHNDAQIIEWGRPIIWLCNRDPRTLMTKESDGIDWDWMDGNVMYCEIGKPLTIFRASTE